MWKWNYRKTPKTALKGMPSGKSPGDDDLTKEFYEHLWDDLKFF